MKKTTFLSGLLLLFVLSVTHAQYNLLPNKVWAMGKNTGLDFRSGSPQVINTHFQAQFSQSHEGSAALADTNGLVFYSNGTTVWNAQGQIMPHGNRICGEQVTTESTTQGALIVPYPGESTGQYFLFSLSDHVDRGKLYCNVVNLNMDNGKGDIDTTFYLHRIALDSTLAEKMIAIPSCDGGIWVVVHDVVKPIFKAYKITAAGINLIPVISDYNNSVVWYNYDYGSMKVSPNFDKVVTASLGPAALELYDFDNGTGMFSNYYQLDNQILPGYYGCSFSPDGSKVYGKMCTVTQTPNASTINQFDLSSPNPAATKTKVGEANSDFADLQLGPDQKIYFASKVDYSNLLPYEGSKYAGRINAPNNAGAACDFQDSVTSLYFVSPTSTGLTGGLPNTIMFPYYDISTITGVVKDTVICRFPASGIDLAAPSGFPGGYEWDNGSTNPLRHISNEGTYWIRVRAYTCHYRTDTFHIKGNLPADLFISQRNDTLTASNSYTSYQWYREGSPLPGETMRSYKINAPNGRYSVKVTNAWGCIDSAAFYVSNGTAIGLTPEMKEQIRVFPNPAHSSVQVQAPAPIQLSLFSIEGKRLLQEKRDMVLDLSNIAEGLYFLQVSDREGRPVKTEKLLISRQP